MTSHKLAHKLLIFLTLIIMMGICYAPVVMAQTWAPLPPYNTLWPLWSPILSPPNPLTGVPTPILSSLTGNTVLPLQPGLTLDPRNDYPYLLYNTLLGMAYFDPLYGVNLWPPRNLLDPILGTPLPINLGLIKGWSTLAPTSTSWLTSYVPVGNNAYYNSYAAYAVAYERALGGTLGSYPLFATLLNPPPAYVSLITAGLILGL